MTAMASSLPLRSARTWVGLGLRHGFASISSNQASIASHPEIEGVLTLTLNRPEAKNSLGHQLMRQLREALQSSKLDQAKCLLIKSGIDGTFCAGADLKVTCKNTVLMQYPQLQAGVCQGLLSTEFLQERAAMSPEEGGEFVKMLRATFSTIAVRACQQQSFYTCL